MTRARPRGRRRATPDAGVLAAAGLAAVVLASAGLAACGRGGAERTGSRATAAVDTGAFRPLAVGDLAPSYAAALIAGPAGAVGTTPTTTARVGGPGPVTLLNVWATWCTACREEMDDLAALHRDYAGRGLRVLAVSVDAGGDARVRRFADDARLPFAVAHDPDGRVQEQFGIVGVPATYLVGRDGRVRWAYTGNLHGQLGAVRAAISSALGGTPRPAPGA